MRAEGGRTRRLTHIAATSSTAKPRKRTPEELPPAEAAALPPKKWKKGTGGMESFAPDDAPAPRGLTAADGGDQDAGDDGETAIDEVAADDGAE